MAGMVWLFNNASLDNKHVLFYLLLAIASIQAVIQERKIIIMQKKIDEDIHDLDGIINMTSLVTVGTKGIHSILE